MSEQENVNIIRKIFDNLNSHDLDANILYLAEDVRVEATGSPLTMNREQGQMFVRRFIDAFPDLKYEIKDLISQGDKVSVSWVARGTHLAPLYFVMSGETIPATNLKVSVPGVTIYELRDNQIIRQEIYLDQVSFLNQLGVLTQDMLSASIRR